MQTVESRGHVSQDMRCSIVNVLNICCLSNGYRALHQDELVRYVCRVMYDGTNFSGWQDQSKTINNPKAERTVQGVLSSRFSTRFNRPMRVTGASRTDLGVHARGQAVHFDAPPGLDLQQIQYQINKILPDDVKIYNASIAPEVSIDKSLVFTDSESQDKHFFHATRSAIGKRYCYRFCTNEFVEPTLRNYYALAYRRTDMELFKECLTYFVGTHNFCAFGNQVDHTMQDFKDNKMYTNYTTIRTVNSIHVMEDENRKGYYIVEFNIKSAIYRMIRNIMGICLNVASSGGVTLDQLKYLIESAPNRKENKSKSAPAEGLTLDHVFYENY